MTVELYSTIRRNISQRPIILPSFLFISFHFYLFRHGSPVSPWELLFRGPWRNVVRLQQFDSFLKDGKRWCPFNIQFKGIPKFRSTKRYDISGRLFSNKSERYSGTRSFRDSEVRFQRRNFYTFAILEVHIISFAGIFTWHLIWN